MHTMSMETEELRLVPAIEPPKLLAPAGRLPMMAFVDAETERALQESSGLLGRNEIIRGGIAQAIKYLNE